VQVKARQLLDDVEQQAAGLLARAKQHVDKGQTEEAMARITELVRTFVGTQAATEGGQMLTTLANRLEIKNEQRSKQARELLAQAREDYRTQQLLSCLDRCDDLASSYADLPEGADAIQLAAQIKNNPEWMKRVCESLSDRLGLLYLSLAPIACRDPDQKGPAAAGGNLSGACAASVPRDPASGGSSGAAVADPGTTDASGGLQEAVMWPCRSLA
jgi:hypothetical protein